MKFGEALKAQPKAFVYAEAALLVVLIGLLDSIGGWDISMFIFYAAPILLLADIAVIDITLRGSRLGHSRAGPFDA